MLDVLLYILLFAILALVAVGGLWFMRSAGDGQSPMTAIFGAKPERRLAIVEHANLDGRRRLVIVRRDNVEHLIMTGGPVDVVIETGISARATAPAVRLDAADDSSVGGSGQTGERRARTFGRLDKAQDAAQ